MAGEHKSEPETIVITVLGLGKGDQPILSLARGNDGGLTISWVGEGVLQSSTDLKNWESIENAAKPHDGRPSRRPQVLPHDPAVISCADLPQASSGSSKN